MNLISKSIAFILLTNSYSAYAGVWHEATAPTQEEAMQKATDAARERATNKKTCFKPAWTKQVVQEKPCAQVIGGVRCWATSANPHGSCNGGRYGWLAYNINETKRSWAGKTAVYPSLPSSFEPTPLPQTLPEPEVHNPNAE
jgi:hypothetical protein